jgi:hypothetical protein
MNTKKKHQKKVSRRHLTLMAVQEKLGLFTKKTAGDEKQQDHEYLKKKPLGLI